MTKVITLILLGLVLGLSVTSISSMMEIQKSYVKVVNKENVAQSTMEDSRSVLAIDTDAEDSSTNVSPVVAWPEGCSWECYLEHNPHLKQTIGGDKAQIERHWVVIGKPANNPCDCESIQTSKSKVVLLAGPHKAASTTLQWISTVYSSMTNHEWEWLIPDFYRQEKRPFDDDKAFAPFMFTLYQSKDKSNITFNELKEIYKNEFEQKISEGKSVIFGSEEIDMVVNPQNIDYEDSLNEVLDIIPSSVRSTTILVIYRSPRISHVKSHWKEVGWWHNSTFYQYLAQEGEHDAFPTYYHSVDSLGLAAAFLKRGINVKLLDLSGVQAKENNDELYTILGCDVMGMECVTTEDNVRMPVAVDTYPSEEKDILLKKLLDPRNVRDDGDYVLNVTKKEMNDIDVFLRRYDCNHEKWIREDNDNLEIMYGKDIYTNMKECRTTLKDMPLSREEMFQSIKTYITSPSEDIIEEDQQTVTSIE